MWVFHHARNPTNDQRDNSGTLVVCAFRRLVWRGHGRRVGVATCNPRVTRQCRVPWNVGLRAAPALRPFIDDSRPRQPYDGLLLSRAAGGGFAGGLSACQVCKEPLGLGIARSGGLQDPLAGLGGVARDAVAVFVELADEAH